MRRRSPRTVDAAAFNGLPASLKWNAVLDGLEQKRKLGVLANFQHARVIAFTADALELGFAHDYALGEMGKSPEHIEIIRQVVRELSGKAIAVNVRMLSEAESAAIPARSVVEERKARGDDERRKREAEAREHPMTRLVLETFGASIKEIKTDV